MDVDDSVVIAGGGGGHGEINGDGQTSTWGLYNSVYR